MKYINIVLVAALLCLPTVASADPLDGGCLGYEKIVCSAGLSVPALAFRPGNPHPFNVAAGIGLQGSLSLPALDRVISGAIWNILSLQGTVFGTVVSNQGGDQFGMLAAAVSLCFMNSIACIGGGHDVVRSDGTLGGQWFGLVSGAIPFAFEPKPPSSMAVQAPLRRGLTIYL